MTAHPDEADAPIVAGHPGRIKITPEGVAKVIRPRELAFYQAVPEGFQTFCPRLISSSELENPDGKSRCVAVLENLLSGCKKPCVMDLKIGLIHYDANATPDKVEYEEYKAKKSTTNDLGFRMTGWHIVRSDGSLDVAGKKEGQALTVETMPDAFRRFFGGDSLRTDVVEACTFRVEQLLQWFQQQTSHHFRASSLLFVYDAAVVQPRAANVHMIDFDHVVPDAGTPDTGVMFGIRNVLDQLKLIVPPH